MKGKAVQINQKSSWTIENIEINQMFGRTLIKNDCHYCLYHPLLLKASSAPGPAPLDWQMTQMQEEGVHYT